MKAGVKQVKNRLSYYLRRVREGELVEVTSRGEVVAELHAPRRRANRSGGLERLVAEGIVTPPERNGRLRPFKPTKLKRPFSVSQMVLDDRR